MTQHSAMKAGHAPMLAQHNAYICRDLLGVPQERVDELAARKVLQ